MAFENVKEAGRHGGRALRNLTLAALIGFGVKSCAVPAVKYFADDMSVTANNAHNQVNYVAGDNSLIGRGAHATLDVASHPVTGKVIGYALLGTGLVLGGAYLKSKLDEDTQNHHPKPHP